MARHAECVGVEGQRQSSRGSSQFPSRMQTSKENKVGNEPLDRHEPISHRRGFVSLAVDVLSRDFAPTRKLGKDARLSSPSHSRLTTQADFCPSDRNLRQATRHKSVVVRRRVVIARSDRRRSGSYVLNAPDCESIQHLF